MVREGAEVALQLQPEEKRRLALLGLEPVEQFPVRMRDKSHETEVVPTHRTNNEESTMETQTHSSTESNGHRADVVDQAHIRTSEAAQKILDRLDQKDSWVARSYSAAETVVTVAAGVAFGGLLVAWLTAPKTPMPEAAPLPMKK